MVEALGFGDLMVSVQVRPYLEVHKELRTTLGDLAI